MHVQVVFKCVVSFFLSEHLVIERHPHYYLWQGMTKLEMKGKPETAD